MASLFLPACEDDDAGEGSITFTTWGEDYIETGIPASEFADGHTVVYSKFIVVMGDLTVASADGVVAAQSETRFVVNQVEPGVKELVSFTGLEAKNYERVSYSLLAPSAGDTIELVGGVTQSDLDRMIDNGYNVYVEGTLSDGATSKTFAWGFGVPTLLDECEGERDGRVTPGAVVTDGGEDVIELTIHGDHLFYDDLQSAAAELRGEAIMAADADNDDVITQAELSAISLFNLPADQYGTGGAAGIDDLEAFIEFLARTVGHFRGEGECFVK